MSRKALIEDEEKEEWSRVRMFTASLGHGPLKSQHATAFDGAVVVLTDDKKQVPGLLEHAKGLAYTLNAEGGGTCSRPVVVMDLSQMKRSMDGDGDEQAPPPSPPQPIVAIAGGGGKGKSKKKRDKNAPPPPPPGWSNAVDAESATSEELTKSVGRPIAKALSRLM